MTTFTELVEKKLGDIFSEFKDHPYITSYVVNGFPMSIASYLTKKMYDETKPYSELVIESPSGKIMKFSLTASKKGDSIAFVPEFSILELGKEYISSDEIEFDSDAIVAFGKELVKNRDFMECVKQAFALNIFSDGEWIELPDKKDDEAGLFYEDENDCAVSLAAVFFKLIEVLCNNKDASQDIDFTVDKLGTFKVSPVKGGYSVHLVFDKEFKSYCKSDVLAEKLSEVIE